MFFFEIWKGVIWPWRGVVNTPWGPCRKRKKPQDYCIFVIPCTENKKRIEKANRRSGKQRSTIRKSFLFGIVKQKKARYRPIVNQKAGVVYNVTFYSYFIHNSFTYLPSRSIGDAVIPLCYYKSIYLLYIMQSMRGCLDNI